MEVPKPKEWKKVWPKPVFAQLISSEKSENTVKSPAKKRQRIHDPPKKNNVLQSNKFNKTIVDVRPAYTPTANRNWIDEFAPTSDEELALHPKKLTELQNWFHHCNAMRRTHPAQMCLLSGPSGCGKTAAVRVLAEHFQYDLHEFITSTDCEVGDAYAAPQLDAFKAFLWRSSRYKSLVDRYNKRLVVVEDFPNVLLSDATAMENIVTGYAEYSRSPLIFIVAESKSRSLNIIYNIFPEEMRQKYRIQHISFNAVATTIMQKAMKRFCGLISGRSDAVAYKVPPSAVIDSIVLAAQGDIRNALLNLHFVALKGGVALEFVAADTSVSAPQNSSKKNSSNAASSRRNKKVCLALKSVGSDQSITMMHALGRVFNPKRGEDERLLHSPEDLATAFSTEPKKFIGFVHANYAGHFADIESIITAIDGLSIADILMEEYRDTALAQLGLNMGIRSVMVANHRPVSGWMPVRGPKRVVVSTQRPPKFLKLNISSGMYASEFSSFVKVIEMGGVKDATKQVYDIQ